MTYTIRPCKRADLPSIVRLCEKHATLEDASFDPTNKIHLLESAIFGEHQLLHCYVVEIDDACIGYYSYTFDFSTWDAKIFLYLDCLYLEPCCRGMGIGKEIMRRLTDEARKKNCMNIQWQTPILNEDAIKFYHAIGGISKQKERFTLMV